MALSHLLQGFSNKSDTDMIQQECYKVDDTCKVVAISLYHDCNRLVEQPCNKSDNVNKVVPFLRVYFSSNQKNF